MNVLAIGAHPDDVELLCGGTLALYADRGDQVTIAIATNGEVGSSFGTKEEIAERRYGEALAAAGRLGAELIWLGYPDEFLFNEEPTRRRFIDAIRQARPRVLFTHSTADYHPDHRTAGQIAQDARIPCAVPLIEGAFPACEIPTVFIMDTLGGHGFAPQQIVDVSTVIDRKSAILGEHRSQREWLHTAYGIEYQDLMRGHAADRGALVGARYGEAFRQLPTFPETGGPELLPNHHPVPR
ncbi:PIG-L deacetylase family protein [Sciscionella sediminilitoris]|uniref:PIG-L deacetylase family protein n=1 Tax=Sciscionella sediminilitoris TaxID=1445613 RepID=UPI0004DF2E20|nr:PIG-L deacetylase family protein [Sciscionella sp. SE31]